MGKQTKEAKATSQKKWYETNKARHIANVRIRKQLIKKESQEFLRTFKESNPCTDCKVFFPYYVMDLDHLRDKKYAVAQMPGEGYDVTAIKRELAKCELVCSNCHRERTFQRLQVPVSEPPPKR